MTLKVAVYIHTYVIMNIILIYVCEVLNFNHTAYTEVISKVLNISVDDITFYFQPAYPPSAAHLA